MKWLIGNDRKIDLDRIQVMGILNVTPDSFSDGGRFFTPEEAVAHAVEMAEQGADIIDIGAQSTRPGYNRLTAQEEWSRLKKVIPAVRQAVKQPLSIDTFYAEVAQKAVAAGVEIINDVTGFDDAAMRETAAATKAGCIITHHDAVGQGMDTAETIKGFFTSRMEEMLALGVEKERLCFDPGVGFGKSNEQNLEAMADFDRLVMDGCAMLIAASRKRFIGTACGVARPEERDFGTVAAHTVACVRGAHIVRAHNIPAAVQAAKICDALKKRG